MNGCLNSTGSYLTRMGRILLLIYSLVASLLFPIFLAAILLHTLGRPRAFWPHLQRLSLVMPKRTSRPGKRVWLHAVSVGEIISCVPLIRRLQDRGYSVFLSTTTESGFVTAQRRYAGVELFYFPLDFWFICNRFLKRIGPNVVLLCEMEIWPAFVHEVYKRGVPLYLISGRLADKEFRNYRAFGWFFRHVFSMFSGLFMQTETYARRVKEICHHNNIKTLGSLKFDVPIDAHQSLIADLLPDGLAICAVSIHPGEEVPIIEAFQTILATFPHTSLVIAPRHSQRMRGIIRTLRRYDLPHTLRSENRKCRTPVFLVDTVGELAGIYPKCHVIIMGGSFSRRIGGHNIIEPALYKKCILCGNHMENFRDIYEMFKGEGALVPTNRESLRHDLQDLLRDKGRILATGEKAFGLVHGKTGASGRIFAAVFG
jgi:3-deoxy-D-manno-octulosonic-acid transferase